ncbi:methionine ABC transporter substrate-binding protein [Cerasibacillus terrae]|uniref:Lipoprotein n=1 Tax=Cerasibacillus terrae TaxID=2498845 RepID=A0A5C8NUT9_9BACI|nr:MetQ/NlpA family ABC transporter substrate-binding protein [Cerasibacillus terrae]TXL64938.1 methionine ABC transporter substrate-binding protein [Cerasibacillus terrae]
MKKWVRLILIALVAIGLAACGADKKEDTTSNDKTADSNEVTTLKVGASPNPHVPILEKAKPILEEKGIDLQIETYTEYIMANQDLDSGDLEANFYQHIPFFELQKKEHGYDFENAGGIHIEPIGIYSKRHESLEELPEGATILLSSSVADHGRMLSLLEAKGLITLKDDIDKTEAVIDDIVENPKDFKFDDSTSPEMLVQMYLNDEGDAVLINSNFALDHDINPMEEAIALEDSDSPYVNIVAIRSEDKDNEALKTLVDVLHSEEIQDFILEEYKGSVVPVDK